ncbi:hypothetical protein GPECTOR_9g731 [Gonium pectorale]|uniref:Uncharacterized protein n=1 Tax=Gonium pectorale TaxID=33097 RepID=A0A150GS63_GONPE|nr:hypothetical protein GPECTOR_9g731 [Gonium pectorale]|eukprot:KXZ52685.1 hypothetical protein GPECTOR_9g731 [Gonium pectorale]
MLACQLTYRLSKRDSLTALREGWKLYEHKFDTIAMAALLRRVRVAQIRSSDYDVAAAQQLLDDMVPRLRAVSLRFGRLRDITAYLHALAKLRSPLPKPAPSKTNGAAAAEGAGDATAAAAQDSAATDDAIDAAGASTAIGTPLAQPTDLLLDLAAFATRDRTSMLQCRPRDLATLLWALRQLLPAEAYDDAKLQVVLDRVALAGLQRLQNFSPLDLRMTALGFATFGPRGLPPAPAATGSKGGAAASATSTGSGGTEASPASWPVTPGKKARSPGEPTAAAADVTPPEERRRSRNARILQAGVHPAKQTCN